MTSTVPVAVGRSDAELISAVRAGDGDAYGELFARHAGAATRLARQLAPAADADDLVSEAFAKVLRVLQQGGGPDLAFRAYLLTAVRRLHVDRVRAGARLHTTDDLTPFDPGVEFQDPVVAEFESTAAARAFASLPERWQLVLWHTEVEGSRPADIAPLLGMSANSVSALAYRAREGLRQAFVAMHAQEIDSDACRWTHEHLGGYVRHGLSRRDAAKVERHLHDCRSCLAVHLELSEVNSDLGGLLAPLLLGGAGAAYAAASAGVVGTAGKSALVLALGRVRDVVAANAATSAVVGVTAATVVTGITVGGLVDGGGPAPTRQSSAGSATPERRISDTGGPASARTGASGPGASGTAPPPTATGVPTTDLPTTGAPTDLPTTGAPTDLPTTELPTTALPSSGPPSTGLPTTAEPSTAGPATDDLPSQDPEDDPTSPEPTSPSSQPPGDQVAADLEVTARAVPAPGTVWLVHVRALGAPSDGAATLTVTATDTDVGIERDARCSASGLGGSCRLGDRNENFTFRVTPTGGLAALTFTVSPGPGTVDPDPADNTVSVTLTPGGRGPAG